MGPNLFVDVTITVDGSLTSSSAHQLGEHVRMNIMNLKFPSSVLSDVRIHVDPLQREEYDPISNKTLLSTPDIYKNRIKALLQRRCPEILGVTEILILYNDQKQISVKIDILLPNASTTTIRDANKIAANIRRILMEEMDEIDAVDVDLELSEMDDRDKQVVLQQPQPWWTTEMRQ